MKIEKKIARVDRVCALSHSIPFILIIDSYLPEVILTLGFSVYSQNSIARKGQFGKRIKNLSSNQEKRKSLTAKVILWGYLR